MNVRLLSSLWALAAVGCDPPAEPADPSTPPPEPVAVAPTSERLVFLGHCRHRTNRAALAVARSA